MIEFFRNLSGGDFMPHGMCYGWDPAVLWLSVISDALIAASYYAIPFLLFYFTKQRRDITFKWILVAFGLFILACGTTHVMGAVTVWNPAYRLEGLIKAVTAIASVATFGLLIPMMPWLIRLPSPAQLESVNRSLAIEVAERRAAEEGVRRANEELEARVAARTAELVQSESRFRQLAEAMPQMVWVASSEGRLEYCNRQLFHFCGATLEQMGSTGWISMVHPDDRSRAAQLWSRSVNGGEPLEVECRLMRNDGASRWFLGRGTPAYDDAGGIVQWIGTCTDIDDQKRSSESLERTLSDLQAEMERRQKLEGQLLQAQKMEAIGRLAGGVAHDFNNLLTAILGYNELLRAEVQDDPELYEYAEEVAHSAERAAALTNQLLLFGRQQVIQPQVLGLNELVLRLEKMLKRIIGEDIMLESRLAAGLLPVKVDPTHVDQLILNLAVNSRDAMPDGGRLTVETANVELTSEFAGRHLGVEPGQYVMLAVSDTGCGMDEATKARLFEPFFTTKERGKGTGLGLSIVYGIVKQNGGEIVVYSEPGKGAAFKIYLPAFAGGEGVVPERKGDDEETLPGTGTILLVEDEEQVRNLARTILTRRGYRVLEARSGIDALRIAREFGEPIDLLLTDVVMPEMGGLELANAIARDWPGIRVLYMSGYTDAGIVQQGVLAPGTLYVQKPFSASDLHAKVRQTLLSPRG
jgi:PAS domain S-box-containing protein